MAKAPAAKKGKSDKKAYRIKKKKNGKRYMVIQKGKIVNGLEKTKILLQEGLIKTGLPKAKEGGEG